MSYLPVQVSTSTTPHKGGSRTHYSLAVSRRPPRAGLRGLASLVHLCTHSLLIQDAHTQHSGIFTSTGADERTNLIGTTTWEHGHIFTVQPRGASCARHIYGNTRSACTVLSRASMSRATRLITRNRTGATWNYSQTPATCRPCAQHTTAARRNLKSHGDIRPAPTNGASPLTRGIRGVRAGSPAYSYIDTLPKFVSILSRGKIGHVQGERAREGW